MLMVRVRYGWLIGCWLWLLIMIRLMIVWFICICFSGVVMVGGLLFIFCRLWVVFWFFCWWMILCGLRLVICKVMVLCVGICSFWVLYIWVILWWKVVRLCFCLVRNCFCSSLWMMCLIGFGKCFLFLFLLDWLGIRFVMRLLFCWVCWIRMYIWCWDKFSVWVVILVVLCLIVFDCVNGLMIFVWWCVCF